NRHRIQVEEEEEEREQEEEREPSRFDEIILFCGNPGVGKSTLCNSIFQTAAFKSGVSRQAVTTCEQRRIYNNKLYIDTPGLADRRLREKAALEIEKALKHNDNYKIVFVVREDNGRMRDADFATIETVCEAIKIPFEYGVVFNQVEAEVAELDLGSEEDFETLDKKPSLAVTLVKDNEVRTKQNAFLSAENENRKKLLSFLNALKANRIPRENVTKLNVADYDAKIEEMETRQQELAAKNAELTKRNEEQAARINTIGAQLQHSTEELRKQIEKTENIKQQQKEEFERQQEEIRKHKQQTEENMIKLLPDGEAILRCLQTGMSFLFLEKFNDTHIEILTKTSIFKSASELHQIQVGGNRGCQISYRGAAELARNLQGTNVKNLDLNTNRIGARGAIEVARNLQGTNVQEIDLWGNQIGDQGAAEFARNLQGTNVKKIRLANNLIGARGAIEVARNLQGTNVQEVDLACNELGDQGIAEFACNLQDTSVRKIILNSNKISNQGLIQFARNLQGTPVRHIHIFDSGLTHQGNIEFAKALLRYNTNVQKVDLFPKGEEQAIRRTCQHIRWKFS
ncbi:MAG: GTPase, partial [Candidatus Amoebophilus sp.]